MSHLSLQFLKFLCENNILGSKLYEFEVAQHIKDTVFISGSLTTVPQIP